MAFSDKQSLDCLSINMQGMYKLHTERTRAEIQTLKEQQCYILYHFRWGVYRADLINTYIHTFFLFLSEKSIIKSIINKTTLNV